MKFSLDLIEKNSDIVKIILDTLKDQVEKTINKALPSIENDIKIIVRDALISEPEYGSLKAGTLRAELGIADVANIDHIVDALVNTLKVSKNPIRANTNTLSGGFTITMIKSDDISGIIYTDEANVIDNIRGYSLPWLEWLLLKGNETLVQNYSVNYTSNPRSRSGMALMIKSNSNWRVPPNFSGKMNDNWTTRAIAKTNDKIINIIKTNIENYI